MSGKSQGSDGFKGHRSIEEIPDEVDIIVVGSGGAALTGALTAALEGLSVLIVEKAGRWGGTTATSGGGVWIPDNPFQREFGVQDSRELALQYLSATVEDVGRPTTTARMEAYVEQGPKMVQALRDAGFRWVFKTNVPDYYPELPGSRVGRTLSIENMDDSQLGIAAQTICRSHYPPLVFKSEQIMALVAPFRSARNVWTLMKILGASAKMWAKGKRPMSMAGQLMQLLQGLNVPVLLNATTHGLVTEDDRVSGIDLSWRGVRKQVIAHKGVLIAAGGFARNGVVRQRYQALNGADSVAVASDTGDWLKWTETLDADLALMDEAWWHPTIEMPNGRRGITAWERAMPHQIMVDQSGHRFANEAASYNDVGRDMVRLHGAEHSWMIMDSRNRNQYAFYVLPSGYVPRSWIKSGHFVKAGTLEELAGKCKIDAGNLKATVERFNEFARRGKDMDFHRGESEYDRSWGDKSYPNPSLGPIESPPFWAVRICPGDLGTKGGLVTDEHGRVLRKDGSAIFGLYAAGNSTASVMGRTYPGAGGTLGPAMSFAYIAMRHAAGAWKRNYEINAGFRVHRKAH